MKRLILMLIVGAMLFALLSCSGKNNAPDGETYTDNYVYTMWKTSESLSVFDVLPSKTQGSENR